MNELKDILKQINFKWLPKHMNHIAEHIIFDKRNISFLAINALFRIANYKIEKSEQPFKNFLKSAVSFHCKQTTV